MNDSPPRFNATTFEAAVRENASLHDVVITVLAADRDKHSTLRYELEAANESGERLQFGVNTERGAVFVLEPLDFETRERHELRLVATDGRFSASTRLLIHVLDVNDRR